MSAFVDSLTPISDDSRNEEVLAKKLQSEVIADEEAMDSAQGRPRSRLDGDLSPKLNTDLSSGKVTVAAHGKKHKLPSELQKINKVPLQEEKLASGHQFNSEHSSSQSVVRVRVESCMFG